MELGGAVFWPFLVPVSADVCRLVGFGHSRARAFLLAVWRRYWDSPAITPTKLAVERAVLYLQFPADAGVCELSVLQ